MIATILTVFRKEFTELRRDRKSLIALAIIIITSGPLMIGILAFAAHAQKDKLSRIELPVVNGASAPALLAFLQRQGVETSNAGADYRRQVANGELAAVLLIPEDFSSQIQQGRAAGVTLLIDSSRDRFNPTQRVLQRLLKAYGEAWGRDRLLLRGLAPVVAQPLEVGEMDLATPAQSASSAGMLIAFYALFTGLMGSLAAALELTAGERERQSLEPLIALPVSPLAIAAGKWLAASAYNLCAVVGSIAGYYITMNLVPLPDSGIAFRFGLPEAAGFLAVLTPFAALVPAALLLAGSTGRSVKEAQASITVLLTLAGLMPLASILRFAKEPDWLVWVPINGQYLLLGKVLRGDTVMGTEWLAAWLVPLLGSILCVWGLSQLLAKEKLLSSR
ncbi:ABC transporter permease [Parachitinimonas caeni]|uniref:ABC transporter permease subunit n=1 Tax=Parachitinimonas caeni TaxID=3031301 RepID=A0ABT7DYV4_9NEIS|nr:ABC transporter permease [Parachitinimonas caeni]MDK2125241.1 ABC transporter permease subunit [Parachitinimonas caeni]